MEGRTQVSLKSREVLQKGESIKKEDKWPNLKKDWEGEFVSYEVKNWKGNRFGLKFRLVGEGVVKRTTKKFS